MKERLVPPRGGREVLKRREPADLAIVQWGLPPEQGWWGQAANETHRRSLADGLKEEERS